MTPAVSQSSSSFVWVPESSPRYERRLLFRDVRHRVDGRLALDSGRIVLRADDDEVVVHDELALAGDARLHQLLFGRGRMRQDGVGFTALAHLDRLSASHRHGLDGAARLLLERRDQFLEEPGVLRARRRRQDHRPLVRGLVVFERRVLASSARGQRDSQPDK